MIMTKKEWDEHCIETGCSMTYKEYVARVQYIIDGFKK